jgi:hypothetical protein
MYLSKRKGPGLTTFALHYIHLALEAVKLALNVSFTQHALNERGRSCWSINRHVLSPELLNGFGINLMLRMSKF